MKQQLWLQAIRDQLLSSSPRRRSRRSVIEAEIERLEPRCLLSAAGGGAVMIFSAGTAGGDDLPDVGHVDASDLIQYDGNQFSLLFDGSDVGLSGADIDAVAIASENQILLSFASATDIAGLGTVDPSDVILFQADSLGDDTAGTFSLFVSAADLGLASAGPAGNIDALDILDDGSLVLSTAGNINLPAGPNGATVFVREADVVQYTPSAPNNYSTGTMQLFFDASDADLSVSSEDIDGFSVNGSQVQLSTTGGYFIDSQGLSGDRQDVLTYQATSLGDNTTGSYAGITFDGSLIFGRPPGETIDLNALDYFNFPQTKNHPPTAQDLTGEVAEDGSVSIQLLGDDGEPDIDQPLTYVIVRGPDHGSITGFDPATGLVTYHPFSNYNGTDQITYLVQETDPNGVVFVSELAVVDITITPVNDAPFLRLGHSQFTGDQNVPLLITGISVGDVEANAAQSPVSVVLSADTGTLTLPTNSTVQISGNGTARITLVGTTSAINQLLSQGVTFQPDADFSGSANLNVTIADSLDPSTALQASATVGIDILSADQQVSGFRQQLIRLVQDGDLSWRIGQKLLAAFHGRLNTHHIRQTIQQIAKLAHKGRIDTGVAQQLIDHLKAINESITTRHAHSFHHALDRFFAKLSHAHRHGHSR